MENATKQDILELDDMEIDRATKDAYYKISFLKDGNGTLVKGDFSSKEAYIAKLNSNNQEKVIAEASDHFAIRPNTYKIAIKEKDENNNSVTYDTSSLLKLVAGHNYQVEANATTNNNTIALKYT